MDRVAAQKILEIQDAMRQEEAYRALCEEHQILNARFLEAAETMTPEQRDAVFDYIGLLIEVHLQMLAYSVSHGE